MYITVYICNILTHLHILIDKPKLLTGVQRDSLLQCPGSHVEYQLSGKVQTYGSSPCPGLTRTHPELPLPCRPHCGKILPSHYSFSGISQYYKSGI